MPATNTAIVAAGPASSRLCTPRAASAARQPRLQDDQDERDRDERRDDRLEGRSGQDQQQDRAGDPAAERRRRQPQQPRALPSKLLSIAERSRRRARHQPDRVRDVGDDRRVAELQQHREREQRPAADDRVDRPSDDPRCEDAQCVKRGQGMNQTKPAGRAARPGRLQSRSLGTSPINYGGCGEAQRAQQARRHRHVDNQRGGDRQRRDRRWRSAPRRLDHRRGCG